MALKPILDLGPGCVRFIRGDLLAWLRSRSRPAAEAAAVTLARAKPR